MCNTTVCIPLSKVCDLQRDCLNGEDEDNNLCGEMTPYLLFFTSDKMYDIFYLVLFYKIKINIWLAFPNKSLRLVHIGDVNKGAACDFEGGLCDWTNYTGSQFHWAWHSGRTPTNNTGPTKDHTTGTLSGLVYIFVQSSYLVDISLFSQVIW